MRQGIEKLEQFVFSVEDGDDDGDGWIQFECEIISKNIEKGFKFGKK